METTTTPTEPMTDDRLTETDTCPVCGGPLANVQGLSACTACSWLQRP